jgi:hypothetical protein
MIKDDPNPIYSPSAQRLHGCPVLSGARHPARAA